MFSPCPGRAPGARSCPCPRGFTPFAVQVSSNRTHHTPACNRFSHCVCHRQITSSMESGVGWRRSSPSRRGWGCSTMVSAVSPFPCCWQLGCTRSTADMATGYTSREGGSGIALLILKKRGGRSSEPGPTTRAPSQAGHHRPGSQGRAADQCWRPGARGQGQGSQAGQPAGGSQGSRTGPPARAVGQGSQAGQPASACGQGQPGQPARTSSQGARATREAGQGLLARAIGQGSRPGTAGQGDQAGRSGRSGVARAIRGDQGGQCPGRPGRPAHPWEPNH